MAQISGKGSKGHHTFRLNVNEVSTSVANNTSTLDASFTIDASGWYWEGWGSNITYSLSIAGNSYSGSIPSIPNKKDYTIRSITGISVPHNDDGTKSISYSFSVKDGANQDYTCGSASASGTLALTNIPRASTISSITSSVNIGSTCSIGISKKLGSYTSTLEYQISGSSTWTSIASKWNPNTNLEQSYSWTVPTSVYNSMTSTETQKTITVRLTTYNGNSSVGSVSTASFTAKATGTPSISSTSVVDTNSTTIALTSDSSKMVNGVSNMKVTVNAAGVNGTTITKITCNGTNMSLSSGVGTLTYNGCTTTSFAIVVTDSRNATKSQTIDISSKKINYVALSASITAEKDQPTSSSAVLTAKGNYSSVTFASGVTNTLTTSYQYRLAGSSDAYTSGTLTVSTSGTTYTGTKTITGLDYTKDYEVKMVVQDKLNKIERTVTLKKGVPVLYWDKNAVYLKSGNAIADYTVTNSSSKTIQFKDGSGNAIYPNPYPVGAIYISYKATSPSSLFGGSWTQLKNAYLFATNATSGDKGTGSGTGTGTGAASGNTAATTLSLSQIPSHSHTVNNHDHAQRTIGNDGNVNPWVSNSSGSSAGVRTQQQTAWHNSGKAQVYTYGSSPGTNAQGGGGSHTHGLNSHTHTVPYLEVYVWKRTA